MIASSVLFFASGCCGGFSVVRTTVASRASLDEGGGDEAGRALGQVPDVQRGEGSAGAYVLHYSRLGEPANACGSGLQYVEDLFIRVPSLREGETFTIGDKGVTALYARRQQGPPSGSKTVSGEVRVIERRGDEVMAELKVTIVLLSDEVVELDDEYTFHPNTP